MHKNPKKTVLFGGIFLFLLVWFVVPVVIFLDTDQVPRSQIVVDVNGNEIGEIIPDNTYRHIPLTKEQVPPFLQDIILTLEDRRFFQHNGIDYTALARAMRNNLEVGASVQGGSTIESQLIRNTYWLNKPRNLWRKVFEFYGARVLDYHKSKEEILTDYVNVLYFGYLNYGFQSASRYFFNKDLKDLTKAEMIALMVIPKNPNKYDPYKKEKNFKERFDMLIYYYLYRNVISQEEYEQIKAEKLTFSMEHDNKLLYIIDFIQNGKMEKLKDGKMLVDQSIETTIDYNLTREVDEVAKATIYDLLWKNVTDYGVIVIDRKTMEMRVMLGGLDYKSIDGQVNAVMALNQAGSAVKPFTYLLAFSEFGMKPEDTILDLPVQYQTDKGYAYTPKNYSLDYKGEVTLAEALSQSLNIPAVKVANKIGVEKLLRFYHQVGLDSLKKGADYYGLALTLGVGEVSLYELTRAFGLFANGGELCDIISLQGQQKDCKRIVDKKYTDMVEMILTNRYFRLKGFPIGSNLDFPDRFVFLKSGTSRNFADNWTVGYTDNYIIGVRVGNKSGAPMKGVSGSAGAGDIFNKIVYMLENRTTDIKPVNLEKQKSDYLQILSPMDQSVYKLDASIPMDKQNIKLDFTTNMQYETASWTVDGQPVSGNFWNLKGGHHEMVVSLFDAGKVVGSERVSVEIQ